MELVQDIVLDHEISAREQGITLTTVAPSESLQVRADIAMIHRLLENLIHNALKHTPEGGAITVTVTSDEAAGACSGVRQRRRHSISGHTAYF